MPTVDDLIISLTIKPTSKLGQLQKQLEAIVGKTGKGVAPAFMYLKKGQDLMKRDLKFVRNRIGYLMPTRIPGAGRPKAMAIAAKTASDLIDLNFKKLAEKMIPTKERDVKNFAGALGIKEQNLQVFLEGKLRDWQYRLEEIMTEVWTTPSAQRFLVRIDDLIKREEMDVGRRKKVFTSIEASISEFNAEVAQLLKKLGIFAIPEFSLFKMTEDVLKAIGDTRGALRLNMKDLEEASKITGSKEAEESYKQIKNIANIPSFKDPLKFIEQSFKTLGITKEEIKPKMFTEAGVMENPRLRAMIPSLIQIATRRGEVSGIPKGFAQVVKNVVNKAIGGEGVKGQFYQYVRPDLLVVSDDVEKLTDVFGEDIAKQITEGFLQFSEFKKELSQENADQFIKYQSYVGDRLFGLSSTIQESFKRFLPDVLTATINIMEKLAKAGAITKLTEEEKETIVEKAEEEQVSENVKKYLEDIFSELTPGAFSEEEQKRIYEYIQGFAHRLGVNPNWVDLPSFTQNIADQIREIRLQTEKIGTIESGELLNKFLQLRDDLEVTMSGKNIQDFIDGLVRTYGDMETMPIPEQEKRELKYGMMKAIVDMRMSEWKTIQEKYTQFPQVIIDSLSQIKEKTQEFQEAKEAKWKEILLGKMDNLIKTVVNYRRELIKEIGRKYIEPEQKKLPREF